MDPLSWDEPTWRARVEAVRAGRSLRPVAWPGGAALAVALSFDADHETPWLRDGESAPAPLSEGEYGARVAMPRILALLERHAARATFFVPAVAALLHPGGWHDLVGSGHEVALHGWIHERPGRLEGDAERELLLRSAEVLERLCGTRPVGYRAPSFDVSPSTIAIAADAGLRYDSSLMADDEPYELLADGRPTGLVELPVDWSRDDAAFLVMDRFGTARPMPSPRDLLGAWLDEYAGARAAGGLLQLTMHPDLIGRRSRLVVLDALLERFTADGDVWMATHADVAAWCLAGTPPGGGM